MKRADEITQNFKLVNNTYTVEDRVGGGSFGDVFIGRDLTTGLKYAIKFEKKCQYVYQTLPKEAKVLNIMEGSPGFAQLMTISTENNYNILVMNLLGPNLEKLFKFCDSRLFCDLDKFSTKTVLMMGIAMLDRIEAFHSKNLLHRDIKPENFVIGVNHENKIVYLIDFGLARLYKNMQGQHVAMRDGYGLIGTARYASINAHLGRELSRRDDLESIGYTLIYFLKGKLPWQDVKGSSRKTKYRKIKEMKMSLPVEKLCEGIPTCFSVFMNYVRNLNFVEAPSYSHLRRILEDSLREFSMKLDNEYDWVIKNRSDRAALGDDVRKSDTEREMYDNRPLKPEPKEAVQVSTPDKQGLVQKSAPNIQQVSFRDGDARNGEKGGGWTWKARKKTKSRFPANENESSLKESTLMATSKYLNHTQLKNETDSLSLLNSRMKKNGQFSTKNSKILERLVEEENEIDEENQMYISDKKKRLQLAQQGVINPENANNLELQEHISETELQMKLTRLTSSM